jgi:hypothetical protein
MRYGIAKIGNSDKKYWEEWRETAHPHVTSGDIKHHNPSGKLFGNVL